MHDSTKQDEQDKQDNFRIAMMLRKNWKEMLPQGHVARCPSAGVLALVLNALKDYSLLDNGQVQRLVKLLESADSSSEVRMLNYMPADDSETIENITKDVSNMLKNASNDVPAFNHFEYDLDIEDDEIEKREFMSISALLSSIEDEAASGTTRSKYMPKLRGLAARKEVIKPAYDAVERLEILKASMPNFVEVIDDILTQVQAQKKMNRAIKLQPIILLGKPGIGKTRFIKQLAASLKTEHHVFNLGGAGDNIKLRGLAKGWSSARPGDIAMKLAHGETFNPFLMFDEVDKSGGRDSLHDVHSLLLAYLERESNDKIEDDYIAMPMDLSGINYIFAANASDTLPDYFLSRLDVYNIPDLTAQEVLNVARCMVVDINAQDFNNMLKSAPSDVLEMLSRSTNAREMRRTAYRAIARAIACGDDVLKISHISIKDKELERKPMGFC